MSFRDAMREYDAKHNRQADVQLFNRKLNLQFFGQVEVQPKCFDGVRCKVFEQVNVQALSS